MNILGRMSACACCLVLTASCIAAGQEEAAIDKVLADVALASTEFPKTRDRQSILKFYAKDFEGIQDGEPQDLPDMQKFFSEFEEQVKRGESPSILSTAAKIKTHVAGNIGWATYDYELKIGRGGDVVHEEQGKCTSVLTKEGPSWLIQHEHCSTPVEAQQIASPAQFEVTLISLTSPVSPGNAASIMVRTAPNAECQITVLYKSGPSKAKGLVPKSADSQGQVTWTWLVGSRTTPGSWPITVTCSVGEGNGKLATSLVVQ